MTDRNPIADITARLEERLAARLVEAIRPLLAGRPAEVQRAVLAALADAAGFFCCFVCDACEANKRGDFNPRIFDRDSRYATTGDERDIEQSQADSNGRQRS